MSRLPAFPAARARARQGSRASKYRACQHKRHVCRACQRFPRPERARGKGPGPLSTAPASPTTPVSRLPAFPAARARGKGPGPLSTAPASPNDACVAPASVSRGPSARQGSRAPKYRACQPKRRLCRACQRFPRPERARGKGPGPLSTAPASPTTPVSRLPAFPAARARARQGSRAPISTAPASPTTPVSRLPAFP